ncbi:ankyrin repeat domain-containing protein [Limibacter armeniacum]|uniref:ankyrin repeat domain-containing protein n=1 Tax=Limibacter armeniacum TaxID=466084 RepID=UPI002FE57E34
MTRLKITSLLFWFLTLSCCVNGYTQNNDYDKLMAAIQGNNVSDLQAMVDRGTDPNARDIFQQTTLHKAAKFGRLECTEVLLEAGADPNARGKNDKTPLYDAVFAGENLIVSTLLTYGADPNLPYGEDEKNLLHLLSDRTNRLSTIIILLDNGADPRAVDRHGKNAIYYARKNKNKELVKLMKKYR